MTSSLSNPPLGESAFAWIKARERWLLLAGCALQLAVLIGMIAGRAWTVMAGQTIYVHVLPVDPRDLMRGDFVVLSYEFNNASNLMGRNLDWQSLQGRTVYAQLEPEGDGKHWRAVHIGFEKPADGLFLRGTVTAFDRIIRHRAVLRPGRQGPHVRGCGALAPAQFRDCRR